MEIAGKDETIESGEVANGVGGDVIVEGQLAFSRGKTLPSLALLLFLPYFAGFLPPHALPPAPQLLPVLADDDLGSGAVDADQLGRLVNTSPVFQNFPDEGLLLLD